MKRGFDKGKSALFARRERSALTKKEGKRYSFAIKY